MTPAIVQKILTQTPDAPMEIRMNDGSSVVVLKREQWLASPDVLVVLDRQGGLHHITYWNITSIHQLRKNGKRAKKR